jgi:hypothetical protein
MRPAVLCVLAGKNPFSDFNAVTTAMGFALLNPSYPLRKSTSPCASPPHSSLCAAAKQPLRVLPRLVKNCVKYRKNEVVHGVRHKVT